MESTNQALEVVVFHLNEELFAIPIQNVLSVERELPITAIPKSLEYVKGMTTIRDNIIFTIDLKDRLIGSKITGTHFNIIIKTENDTMFGIMVDRADDIIQINREEIRKINMLVHDGQSLDVITYKEQLIILLDAEQLLDENMRISFEEIANFN